MKRLTVLASISSRRRMPWRAGPAVLFASLLLAMWHTPAAAQDLDTSRLWEVDAARLIGSEWLDVHATPGEEQPVIDRLARSSTDVSLTGGRQDLQVERPDPKHPDETEIVTQRWVEVTAAGGTGWVDFHYLKPHIAGESLLCFLYLYGLLGIVFVAGMVYAWRQGDVGWGDRRQLHNLIVMTGGMLLYAVIHGFFQFVAPGF
jgi:hypothetical protein